LAARPLFVIGDFAAGLAKTFADKALQDAKEAQKTGRQLPYLLHTLE